MKSFNFFLLTMSILVLSFQQLPASPHNKFLLLPSRKAASLFDMKQKSRSHHKKRKQCRHNPRTKIFEHNIQLQLSDSLGFPVEGTEFWVTLDIIKEGPKVTIQFPVINFQTGQVSSLAPLSPFVPGGYLYTAKGFLPEELRPTDLVNRAVLAPSNDGAGQSYSFAAPVPPAPPSGYILQVTNAGAVVVQCAGTFGNIIPPGQQTLFPCEITYIVKPTQDLKHNVKISKGATDTTGFTDPRAANDGFRDSHVNDAFDNVVAWAWCDNSTVVDKTNNTLNVIVAIGKVNKSGKLKVKHRVQLTDFPAQIEAWDTAVAINRTDKNNIIVSYGVLDHTVHPTQSFLYRAVSFDGGKTWPQNGPLNIQPINGFGDAEGVASDKYGNIWYGATEFGLDATTRPIFYVSTDKGVTFEFVYEFPPVEDPATQFYDFPQYCFGGDGNGGYTLYAQSSFTDLAVFDFTPTVASLKIKGLGDFGPSEFSILPQFTNNFVEADLTASQDGRVWFQGVIWPFAESYINPKEILFKSPGAIDENYAGPWDFAIVKDKALYAAIFGLPSEIISQPADGYLLSFIPRSIIFDDKRQALYAVFAMQSPDYSQNMRLVFIISRDNGQTWSNPINISNTDFANRGFQSMALDSVTGNLVFGWYDGRNDKSFKSVQYYGAVIPAQKLDALVNSIPLSNPLYITPSFVPQGNANKTIDLQRIEMMKKHLSGKFKRQLEVKQKI